MSIWAEVDYLQDKVYSTTIQYVEIERLHLYELTFWPKLLYFLSMRIILGKV